MDYQHRRFTHAPFTRWASAAAIFASLGCGMVGCSDSVDTIGGDTDRDTARQPLNSRVFITPDELEELRAAGDVSILDVRNAEQFATGHIPGALNAEWSVFRDVSREGEYTEDDPVLVERTARALGLSQDRPIVVYGNGRTTSHARLAWSLEYYGHANVFILDGGLDAWTAATGQSATTEPTVVEPGDFTVAFRPEVLVTRERVEAALEDDRVIFFDARSSGEYAGEDERGNPRAGHIPGAIHYEWTNVFQEDGSLRPANDIRAELDGLGLLDPDKVVVAYCQGGFRSAVIYSVLRWLGQPEVANYDGSWWEYSRDSDLPARVTPASP